MMGRLAEACQRPVSRETIEKLESYAALLRDENRRQNLVSGSTLNVLWERHIIDSAQLVRFEPHARASWADIGSGAGLPGIVIACIVYGPVTLIEPRRLRAEFLHKVCESLGLNASVFVGRAEHAEGTFDVLTARAVTTRSTAEDIRTSVHKKYRLGASKGPQGCGGTGRSAADVARYVPRGT